MVRKTVSAFLPEKASTCVLVDLHGYDAWPALAALEENVSSLPSVKYGITPKELEL